MDQKWWKDKVNYLIMGWINVRKEWKKEWIRLKARKESGKDEKSGEKEEKEQLLQKESEDLVPKPQKAFIIPLARSFPSHQGDRLSCHACQENCPGWQH